ncbi:hypothetical protein FHS29_002331 [Saccharothrix tamanrassetensis]|uniref:Ricin B lectin domain-containing protein n=1 Tax=Saccharothrix tamanrassetensis TaxID=1051531 RepID=A0A841CFI0_9PSEU|nr:RICIN domain-containing protein [Saccharothrix tamanrassetensis]MBB5955750.1 hypothetical protein [Saccharothrix tamanrassetensis]
MIRKIGVALAACAALVTAATPATADQVTGGRYWQHGDGKLELYRTGLCLDAALEEIGRNGGKVQLWTCGMGGDEQRWDAVQTDRGGQLLVNRLSGRCLDVALEEIDLEGGRVQLWDCGWGGDEQLWQIDRHQGDVFIDSRATRGRLGVRGQEDLRDGSPVGMWFKS